MSLAEVRAPRLPVADGRAAGSRAAAEPDALPAPQQSSSTRSTGIIRVDVAALGFGAYDYLAFGARASDLSHFARPSAVATANVTTGSGLFLPIGQEVTRRARMANAASSLYCVALIARLVLVAKARQADVGARWVIGFATFVAGCFAAGTATDRVSIALGVGALASLVWLVAASRRARPR